MAKESARVADNQPIYGGLVGRDHVLDVVHEEIEDDRVRKIESVLRNRCGSVHVLLEELEDTSNGSACLRTCEAYGLQYVHVIDTKGHGKASRGDASMSSGKWLSVKYYDSTWEPITFLKEQGFTLISAVFDVDRLPLGSCSVPNSVSIETMDFHKFDKICLMFGSESKGLTGGLKITAHYRVFVPMQGFVSALNLSPFLSLFIYELFLQKRLSADLTDEEIGQLYRKWVCRSVAKRKNLDKELKRKLIELSRDNPINPGRRPNRKGDQGQLEQVDDREVV
uniref:tRNA/rRNA methyltransferase SpoU type domain-containing protein n=1 Tax=Rhodosorus marinus TaxID=101924 RepID=A0A7S2ZZQ6_9RHOD|mmetsp:Transcript_3927/g.16770  ORF Transcript_3927/g.16770 Transcript_3927/m.16770 type:complete len:281 (+) Transcript_3927:1486-2328(+)|eukprot:CAMPEP_0113955908 /NCGR_PEP_ID=MMETSP0011_2-20120614/1707_1 /TAXON_ID=101924 /ORGANISM="Rhodosorus marinus" /LENGTH=280 /DNA_ID=CAMNT_0000965875 /DNA_START=1392 /DNA_END=2234 /DNA_ORIENTATION=+ /assembly_acc=CAM_ASM_000156